MNEWLRHLAELPPVLVYGALFGLLVLEGTGLPLVPFEPAFLAAGVLIREGRMSAAGALLAGTVAHLLGNLGGYLVGRRLGLTALHLHGERLGLSRERIEAAAAWLRRRGGVATLVSRFVGVLRTPAILGAGAAGMDPRAYAAWSLLAGFLWCSAWLAGSVLLGAPALGYLQRLGAAGLVLLAVALAAFLAWHLRLRAAAPAPGRERDGRGGNPPA